MYNYGKDVNSIQNEIDDLEHSNPKLASSVIQKRILKKPRPNIDRQLGIPNIAGIAGNIFGNIGALVVRYQGYLDYYKNRKF